MHYKYPEDFYKGKLTGKVVVQFLVNIEGNIEDVKIVYSDNSYFDKIATDIIKASPKWNHAIQYNRPVKAFRKQPLTFASVPDE